jgi:hypothetical protein
VRQQQQQQQQQDQQQLLLQSLLSLRLPLLPLWMLPAVHQP